MTTNSSTLYGIEQNPKLGYYTVGDKIFYSKPQAFIYATQTKSHYPEWHFNDIEFAKFNWTVEPELNIRELYRIRASQLREKYDYIQVEASGGSDSTTAIFSFLLNGIHLDEVIFRYPEKLDKNVKGDPYNTSSENTLSERQFAAEPLFRWINTNFPKVKTTVYDYSEHLFSGKYMKDESWIFNTQSWIQPAHSIKHNRDIKQQRILEDSGKKICVLYGIDKPKIALINNKWYLYFMDLQANCPTPVVGDYTNITTEIFYWTPDLPELVCKQAHLIKSWFDMPQNNNLKHLVRYPLRNANHRTGYENIAKGIIYPDYDPNTWQTAKASRNAFSEMDHWFHVNMKGTKFYDVWESGVKYLTDNVDPKYFQYQAGRPDGIHICKSKMYYLGDENTKYAPTPALVNQDYKKSIQETIDTVVNKKLVKINVYQDGQNR
jgi:hypothetical protein